MTLHFGNFLSLLATSAVVTALSMYYCQQQQFSPELVKPRLTIWQQTQETTNFNKLLTDSR